MSRYLVRAEKFIPVPVQYVFDIVADPRKHSLIDGSGTVRETNVTGPKKLALGSEFGIDMTFGRKRYRMTNTVVEFEEGRRITWQPQGDYVWRYTFEPVEGGTLVAEEWDASTSKRRFFMGLLGFPGRNQRGITRTLERLHDVAIGVAPTQWLRGLRA